MIFNLSRTALPGDVLEIDLLPQLTEEEVAAAVEAHTTDGLLDPQIAAYLSVSNSVEATVAKAHRMAFTVTGTSAKVVPQVCIGGISVEQVSTNTLEAYNIPGLFIAGEALDIDAQCGGFNPLVGVEERYGCRTGCRKKRWSELRIFERGQLTCWKYQTLKFMLLLFVSILLKNQRWGLTRCFALSESLQMRLPHMSCINAQLMHVKETILFLSSPTTYTLKVACSGTKTP